MKSTTKSFPIRFFAAFVILALAFALLAFMAAIAAQTSTAAPSSRAALVVVPTTTEGLPAGAVISTVLPNMDAPIAMAFDPAGRLFYTEKATGNVRLFANGVLQTAPVITFSVDSCSERGLLGITIDPNFNANHYIYVYYTASSGCGSTENRVARFVENNGVGSNPVTIFTSPQTAGNHNGGNIHFGPDGKLYISIGENANPANSQDVMVKNGKIHRINGDGTIPSGNPVFTQTGALPSLFALGLRNSFDFDFDPLTPLSPYPRIFASENGPSCDDEMNRIEARYNYGWRPSYPCDDASPSPVYNTIPPLWYLPSSQCCEAPTGTKVYTGWQVPAWQNSLFMCAFNSGALRHFYLSPDRTTATNVAAVSGVTCNTDIETGPDGAFYYIEGGGYSPGTLKKITVPGAPSPTGTQAGATPTSTIMPMTHTSTPTRVPTQTPGGNTATPEPTNTPLPTSTVIATPSPCTITFSDVPPGSTFYPFVQCLACQDIVVGYDDGTFRPNNNVIRGQVAKIVANAAGFDSPIPDGQQTFEDVPPGSTFYIYIERLASSGVMSGYPCGGPGEPCVTPGNHPYFRPFNNATRGQIAKIVSNAAGFNNDIPAGTQTFQDVSEGSTFHLFIERLILNRPGVISGYPCGSPGEPCVTPGNHPYFRPFNNATRGQTAKIVSNTFFPDCVVPVRVKIEQFAFQPNDVTIRVGTMIRFVNRDGVYHTATAVDSSFDTGSIYQNQFVDITFNTPGDFEYYCQPHPFMRGFIHVVP